MKMKAAQKVSYDSGPNMTPLVDVVMVILIFLMMVGQFGAMEHYLLSNVPLITDGSTQNYDSLEKIKDTIEISVTPTADGFRWAVTSSGLTPGQGDLDSVLRTLKAGLEARNRTAEDIQVIIAPQRTVKYMHLIKVYEAAMRAKYTKIAFRGVS